MTDSQSCAAQIIQHAVAMGRYGLNQGSAGNLSQRDEINGQTGFWITPTGMPYETLQTNDIVFVGLDGQSHGRRKPSSEWRLHRDIYRAKPETGSILHAHSPFATSLACLRREIPPFHYMIARFGGDTVRCADYALFGTQALSDQAILAMQERTACLLANHGMITAAANLPAVLAAAIELETLCEHYWRALQIGAPILLSATEMNEVFLQFADYGRQAPI